MSAVRFGWEYHPNPARATLHCDQKLFQRFGSCGIVDDKNLTRDQMDLVDAILAIHGVDEMGCRNYELWVHRGAVFSWQEIIPRVEDVLAKWLGATSIKRVKAEAGI